MEAARGVVLGFDVGRYSHHMTAIDASTGEVVASAPVGQGEAQIRDAIGPHLGHGATVVVDQPGDLSSLLFAALHGSVSGFPTQLVLGLAIVGLEVGFIYAYQAGWEVSRAAIVQSAFLAVALIGVGAALYREPVTWNKVLGVAVCLAGLALINMK